MRVKWKTLDIVQYNMLYVCVIFAQKGIIEIISIFSQLLNQQPTNMGSVYSHNEITKQTLNLKINRPIIFRNLRAVRHVYLPPLPPLPTPHRLQHHPLRYPPPPSTLKRFFLNSRRTGEAKNVGGGGIPVIITAWNAFDFH